MIRKLLKNLLGENFTENNAKLATVNFAIILLMFLLSGIMLFFLPEQISILHTGDTYYLTQRFSCLAAPNHCAGYKHRLYQTEATFKNE